MASAIITLTTDFGLKDPYAAEMKAVILGICPNAQIVDVTHEIEKFNVRMGSYVLACAAPYFPERTIHVAVVDPGVGTKRRPILIETEKNFFVGPDNGLLSLAARAQGIRHVYEISNRRLMLSKVSGTFHGRDVFAPAAAHLARGVSPTEFGREIRGIVTPKFAEAVRNGNTVVGEVIHVDDFGNIITNLQEGELEPLNAGEIIAVKVNNRRITLKLCKAYAEVKKQEPLAIIGSHGFLEISINQGNAAKKFGAKVEDKVTLYHF
ncbi:MAG: S-adenosyl-l-methionine hydroxide adenosyltransferase family protein [Candidatus Bathyarchaeia archaeon]